MIDLAHETLLTLRQAAKRFPGRKGKGVHVSAVYRWANGGVRGVRLETLPVGGTLYTSVEALQRFGVALAYARKLPAAREPDRRAVERARKELAKHGF